MVESNGGPTALTRMPTGLSGLDEITDGGLLKAGVYIFQGRPGAGKTILANQIAYHHVANGGRVAYVTMLAESHARLLQHLQRLSFFDESAVPDSIYYVSAFSVLRAEGLQGMIALLRGEIRAQKPSMLVLDGLVMAANVAGSDDSMKLFVSEIQAHAALTGCTTLILTSDDADKPISAEHTMVDGIFSMRETSFGPRRERNVEVVKFRGSATLRGTHAFDIGPDGITIYPRLEAAFTQSPADAIQAHGMSTGVADLDRLIELGGLPQHSVTAIAGYSGSGKTTLALHFIGQSSAAEPGLWLSFFESPETLMRVAKRLDYDLASTRADGGLEFLWYSFGENGLDAIAYRLLARVRELGAKRVVIDGLGGFASATAYGDRGSGFFAALTNELRRMGATTVITAETADGTTHPLPVPTEGLSALADNLIRVRLDDHGTRIRRFLSICKMRTCTYDQRIFEASLTQGGLELAPLEPGGTGPLQP